ncbi:MAG: TRAP transporter small permease, partial [Rhodospirillales bacterium]|nr:TRAP transporter small permease [Rhodospirillales bacterium]
MGLAARLYDGIFNLLAIIVALCVVLITALVCGDVILRNSGLPTIPWQIEVSEYAQ